MAELNPSPGHRTQIELFKSARQELTRLFHLYRIPPEDAEAILAETQLLLVYRWGLLEDPRSWLIHSVRSRCIALRRQRRKGLAEAVDAALRDLLPHAPDDDQDRLRGDLEKLLGGLPRACQLFLRQRYGLPGLPSEGAGARSEDGHSADAPCRCLEQVADRLLQLDPAPRPTTTRDVHRRSTS